MAAAFAVTATAQSPYTPTVPPDEPAMTGTPAPVTDAGKTAEKTQPASPQLKNFLDKAAIGGMTEVEAGKLAAEQGSSDKVKEFGQRMVQEHTILGDQIADLAEKKNVTLPAAPDAAHQAMLDALKAKQGKLFDAEFVADMKKGHADAIQLFKRASKASDPDVARFASSNLPTLEDHEKNIPTVTM